MLTCFAFELGSPTLKHILQVLIKRYIDKKAALEKICKCKFMKFSMARNFRKMFSEQLSVFLNSRREGTSFYFTYAIHKIQTF